MGCGSRNCNEREAAVEHNSETTRHVCDGHTQQHPTNPQDRVKGNCVWCLTEIDLITVQRECVADWNMWSLGKCLNKIHNASSIHESTDRQEMFDSFSVDITCESCFVECINVHVQQITENVHYNASKTRKQKKIRLLPHIAIRKGTHSNPV